MIEEKPSLEQRIRSGEPLEIQTELMKLKPSIIQRAGKSMKNRLVVFYNRNIEEHKNKFLAGYLKKLNRNFFVVTIGAKRLKGNKHYGTKNLWRSLEKYDFVQYLGEWNSCPGRFSQIQEHDLVSTRRSWTPWRVGNVWRMWPGFNSDIKKFIENKYGKFEDDKINWPEFSSWLEENKFCYKLILQNEGFRFGYNKVLDLEDHIGVWRYDSKTKRFQPLNYFYNDKK